MTDARVAVVLTARNEEGSLLEKYYRFLFAKERSSRLVAKKDLEADLKEVHSDIHRQDPIVLPPNMPPLPSPHYQLDISPPKWSEVVETVHCTRAASSPGPNGVPYRLYKNTPDVLWVLWKLMTMVWQKQSIRRGPYSQGKELYYQPVSSHRPPERRGKDFLQCPGMQTGWLPREEWLH